MDAAEAAAAVGAQPYQFSTNGALRAGGGGDGELASDRYHSGAPQKLIPIVVFCTSEDEHFPVTELCRAIPSTRGWQSAKQCNYPQQIGLRFDGEVYMEQLQLLSHEAKISARVEIHVAEATDSERASRVFPPYEQCAFRNLGYVALRNNSSNQFKSGEMKSCLVRSRVLYIKLLLWEPHAHALNFYRQVGLTSVICVGSMETPFHPSAAHPHQRATIGGVRTLIDSSQQPPAEYVRGALSPLELLQMDLAYDLVVVGKIKDMSALKERAVQEENFELAQRLKEQIATLYPLGAQIQSLESRKKQALLEEDFQLAHQLKADIEELRAAVAAMRVGLHSHHFNAQAFASRQQGGGGWSHQTPLAAKRFGAADSPNALASRIDDVSYVPSNHSSPGAGGGGAIRNAGRVSLNPLSSMQQQQQQHPQDPAPFQQNQPHAPVSSNPFDEVPAVASGAYRLGPGEGRLGPGDASPSPHRGSGEIRAPINSKKLLHHDQRFAELITRQAPEEEPPNDIADGSGFVAFDKIVAALGVYATCCLFSKRHQLREAAMRVLAVHADDVLHHCAAVDIVDALVLYLGNPGFGLADNVTPCLFAAAELLGRILDGSFHGNSADVMRQRHADVVAPLLPRLGDANPKVRATAAACFNKLLHFSAVGVDKVCLPIMADKGKNFRLCSGRIDVIQDAILDVVGLQGEWERHEALRLAHIMKAAVLPALAHSHIQVREKGYDLLCLAQLYYGATALQPYIAEFKPSQKKILDERMGLLQKNGRPQPTKHVLGGGPHDDEAAAGDAPSPQRKLAPKIRHAVAANRRNSAGDVDGEGTHEAQGDDDVPDAPMAPGRQSSAGASENKQQQQQQPTSFVRKRLWNATAQAEQLPEKPPRRAPPPPVPGRCQFCGLDDEAFVDHSELVQHFMAECPMLCTCPLCKFPVEIREVHWHLAEDCEFKSRVRQCPRCFETVRADELDEHVAKKQCNVYSTEHFHCPLCQEKMPTGDAFWDIHILTPPYCRANPRTSSTA